MGRRDPRGRRRPVARSGVGAALRGDAARPGYRRAESGRGQGIAGLSRPRALAGRFDAQLPDPRFRFLCRGDLARTRCGRGYDQRRARRDRLTGFGSFVTLTNVRYIQSY